MLQPVNATRRPLPTRPGAPQRLLLLIAGLALTLGATPSVWAQTPLPVTPTDQRSDIDFERTGTHDANRIRTQFSNFGMVGDYTTNPDLSVFHSVEVPKGSGLNYSDGITPYVLARITQENGRQAYVMLTGYRERQATSPFTQRTMRFEPRPGYAEPDPAINAGRSIAISNDPRTWPGATDAAGNIIEGQNPAECWYDKRDDEDDPGWCGDWNGFFGKRPNADQESYYVMDDNYYDAFNFYPDSRDRTRRGLGLRVEVRGFQWANPQAQNVIFWHYDIVNEGTTRYDDIIFGLYMDSGVGGAGQSCDGVAESDDDNARYVNDLLGPDADVDLVYTWDERGHGVSLSSNCAETGYLGYAYLETPGDATDMLDNDDDGIVDEMRDSGPGQRIEGQDNIRNEMLARGYDLALFAETYGPLEERPAYLAEVWWTGDEDLDWTAEFSDTGADGIYADDDNEPDSGENDGMPTEGEPNFDRTDITESDQIGLTGFKLNRIAGSGETDDIVFFARQERNWPEMLYNQFSSADPGVRFDDTIVTDYNVGFLFASGPFPLEIGRRERFSLALAYGEDLTELTDNVEVVQSIYNANYQFATPPPAPTVNAFSGISNTGTPYVTLTWDNTAERSIDPVTNRNDFEGYRVYRSTDPNFLDPQVVLDGRGGGPLGNGRPEVQFDLVNDVSGYSDLAVSGVQYYLGDNTGITHTWTDLSVVAGQTYYYAVTAYDRGSEEFNFYPSENAITVSRTPRGGTILPVNVVEVRPNPAVPGYVGAMIAEGSLEQVGGDGTGEVDIRVLNSAEVPDAHRFRIDFVGEEDSVRAEGYTMTNLDTGEVVFEGGEDLAGQGNGPVGFGLQPVIDTPETVEVDSTASGFTAESSTDAAFQARYTNALPINLRRPGFPEDLVVTFADVPIDTSRAAIGAPAVPSHFKIVTAESGRQLDFRFRDLDGDRTLSRQGEAITVLTPAEEGSSALRPAWEIVLDTSVVAEADNPPGEGDVYRLVVNEPFGANDAFEFAVLAERIDPDAARSAFGEQDPYVVPNPYVAAASFEPERFATGGRGNRRLEFRAIPAGATIRIYTVRGQLVQTLQQDGSTAGFVPWDLRSKDNLEIAPGLYIFHVDANGTSAGDIGTYIGKFAVIKGVCLRLGAGGNAEGPGRGRKTTNTMFATRSFAFAALVLVSLLPVRASAQSKSGTTIGDFLMIEPSAQVAAMGNAGATALNGAMAAYYNPGALGRLTESSAQFTHSPWLADIQYNYASVAVKMGANALLLSVTSLNSGDMDVRTVDMPQGTGEQFTVNDLSLGLGFGRQITDRFSAGLQVKYVQETIWHSSLSAVGMDIGVIYELPFRAYLGASISNFGTRGSFDGRDLRVRYDQDTEIFGDNSSLPAALETEEYPLPIFFRVGVGVPVQIGADSRVMIVADAYQPSNNTNSVSFGAEWGYADLLFLRGGYQNLFLEDAEGGLTLGGGLRYQLSGFDLGFDYAWGDHGRLGSAQRFTLGFGF
jgi:hypothetical protein